MKITSAYIEITNRCNLDCCSCYNRSGKKHLRQELSYSDFSTIADRLKGVFGCQHFTISGGEPTLHSAFDPILDKALSLDTEATVVTNGTILSQKLIDSYNTTDMSLQISLDGSCEEINAITRGAGNFTKTVRFIEKLDRKKTPTLKMVVSQNNVEDIAAFFAFAVSMHCLPTFDFITSMGNAKDTWNDLALTAKQKLSVLRTIDVLNQSYAVKSTPPFCSYSCPLSDTQTELSVLIKSNANVYPCQMLYDEKYRLGNLLTDDVEVFNNAFQKISSIAETREQMDFGCTRCIVKDTCKKGCMAFAEMKHGNPLADDGECLYRKLQFIGFEALHPEEVNHGVY